MQNITIKTSVSKLYEFITQMMILLENDLHNIDHEDPDLKLKRNMTSILNNLVGMILQLNKLIKDENLFLAESLSAEDLAIIERFMERYVTK